MKALVHNIASVFIACVLFSCSGVQAGMSQLDQAEALMRAHPDSSLIILQQIDASTLATKALQARYALLYTQALDKNYLPIQGDSLINIAVHYYEYEKYNASKLAWAYLYLGSAYAQMDSVNLAITTYNKALDLLEKYPDEELLSVVSSEKGALYQEQRHFNEALELFKASLAASMRSGNIKHENYALGRVGDAFYYSGLSLDSAKFYYEEARTMALLRKDSTYLYHINIGICAVLRKQKKYDEAKELLTELIYEMHGQNISAFEHYPLLSMLFLDLKQIDSACYYMRVVLENVNATPVERAGALAGMKAIEERTGNAHEALWYDAQYKALADSIQKSYIAHDVRITEKDVFHQKLESKNQHQKTRYMTIIVGVSLLFITIAVGIRYRWKRRNALQSKDFEEVLSQQSEGFEKALIQQQQAEIQKRQLLIQSWNRPVFRKEFESKAMHQSQDVFFTQVTTAASYAYSGLLTRLKKNFPNLTEADIVFTCLLYSGYSYQKIHVDFYKTWSAHSMRERLSQIYKKMGVTIDRKNRRSVEETIIDLCLQGKI